VVHVNGLVARELEPPVDLLALECLRLLLRYADDTIPSRTPRCRPNPDWRHRPSAPCGRTDRSNLLAAPPSPSRHRELLGHLPQHHRRRIGLPNCSRMNVTNRRLSQWPDVPVQVQSVQTFHFQRDVSAQQFGIFAIPRFYGIPRPVARRFEVEDLASISNSRSAFPTFRISN